MPGGTPGVPGAAEATGEGWPGRAAMGDGAMRDDDDGGRPGVGGSGVGVAPLGGPGRGVVPLAPGVDAGPVELDPEGPAAAPAPVPAAAARAPDVVAPAAAAAAVPFGNGSAAAGGVGGGVGSRTCPCE
jgi:hypothetical protein